MYRIVMHMLKKYPAFAPLQCLILEGIRQHQQAPMLATDPLVNEYFPHYLPSEDCGASAIFSMERVLLAQEELSITAKLVAGKPQLQEQLQARAGEHVSKHKRVQCKVVM